MSSLPNLEQAQGLLYLSSLVLVLNSVSSSQVEATTKSSGEGSTFPEGTEGRERTEILRTWSTVCEPPRLAMCLERASSPASKDAAPAAASSGEIPRCTCVFAISLALCQQVWSRFEASRPMRAHSSKCFMVREGSQA